MIRVLVVLAYLVSPWPRRSRRRRLRPRTPGELRSRRSAPCGRSTRRRSSTGRRDTGSRPSRLARSRAARVGADPGLLGVARVGQRAGDDQPSLRPRLHHRRVSARTRTTSAAASWPDRLADEKKCPNMYVDQLRAIEDVTDRVRRRITARTPTAQVAQRDSADRRDPGGVQAAAGRDLPGGELLPGRALLALPLPPLQRHPAGDGARGGRGFFGGDPDNFTYPRFDLDLTLLRVYENDAPLRPAEYLQWSKAGAKEGDLVFVIGNPGSTGRLLTVAQLEYLRDVEYPGAARQPRPRIWRSSRSYMRDDEERTRRAGEPDLQRRRTRTRR